ncbi:MAG: chloride channel protein, partial [Clostridia bacterium]|nr:chloride channel protein [Clostridia bacterium]
MEKQLKIKTLKSLYKNALELILVGGLTGIFVGFTVTVFNLLAHEGEEISSGVYAYVRANPAFIPLLLLALTIGAFLIGTLLRVSEIICGCGIPHAEGATRGSIRFRWWRDATAMFAASLLGVFMGLSIGAEGPSIFIGAACGDGVATITKRNEMIKRYQITGGACAGLAVAANAPLTGMAFAYEEAHKRF